MCPRILDVEALKRCSKCGIVKDKSNFYKDKRVASGLWAKCIACHKVWEHAYRAANPDKIRLLRRRAYQKFREQRKADAKIYRAKYPDRVKAVNRNKRFKYLYGISLTEYNQMFDSQSGLCAICGKPESRLTVSGKPFNLSVDHNHQTGKIRQLLCYSCNSVIGYIKEDLKTAQALFNYLNKWVN